MEEYVGNAMGGLIGLLIVIAVGAVVGWVASLIVKGAGSGVLVNIVIGVAGAFSRAGSCPSSACPRPAAAWAAWSPP
jgi:hypothetical protein